MAEGGGVFHSQRGVFADPLVIKAVITCGRGTGDRDWSRSALGDGIRHCEYPIECIQFHPESVLTGSSPVDRRLAG